LEEYFGRLWESFPPARYFTALISRDLELGFIVINASLVAFGIWCFLWPVRRQWISAGFFAWLWVVIEVVNGVGHPFWSVRQGAYTPGVVTALVLLPIALYLARRLTLRPVGALPRSDLSSDAKL
jgi:hypothetical protein